VEKHTPAGEESNLFELIDALFGGDRARTLELSREILNRGSVDSNGARVTEPQGLLLQFIGSAIYRGRQVRDIHRVRASGGGDDDIMREAGIAKFLLPRLKAQSASMSPERLSGLFHQLFEADRDLKSGAGPRAAELLERIVVRC